MAVLDIHIIVVYRPNSKKVIKYQHWLLVAYNSSID